MPCTSSEEWRHLCEARTVLRMPSADRRRAYFALVEKHRNVEAANKLKEKVMELWSGQKKDIHG